MRPQDTRRHGAPGGPAVCQRELLSPSRQFFQTFDFEQGDGQRQIPLRPDVGSPQCPEVVDVHAPGANAGDPQEGAAPHGIRSTSQIGEFEPPIEHPFKRLLNGGNEIEFYRCLALGERCVARARYANVQLKEGRSGPMLMVDIETEFRSEAGEILLINRQTLIWR